MKPNHSNACSRWLRFAKSVPAVSTLLACTLLTACATYRPASQEEAAALASSIKAGDVITCEMRLGPSKSFKVEAIRDGWLFGDSAEHVFLQDVTRIKVWRHALGDAVLRGAASVATLGALGVATQDFSAAESVVPGEVWKGLATTPAPSTEQPHRVIPTIKVGETITCDTRYSPSRTFQVTAINQDWLTGDSGERVFINDISRLQIHRPAKADMILAAGLLAVTAVVLYNTPLGALAAAP